MKLHPLIQNSCKRTRIIVAATVAVLVLALIIFGGHKEKPAPHVITPLTQIEPQTPVEPAPPGNAELILQLFNPNDQSLKHQLSTTVFSQQIEQAMTVSYVLIKCRMVSQDDYSNTFRALIMYAQQTKLAADEPSAETLVRQLAESANADYALIYGRTPCNDKQLPTLAAQLAQWVNAVMSR
jgi:hypothetical protein